MSDNFGPGVSRVLASDATQYLETIWQQGTPPTDADLNLLQTLAFSAVQSSVLRGCPSGFLGNETNTQAAYLTNQQWSNFFKFGPQRAGEESSVMWANVNGWLVPVTGTRTGRPPGSPNDTDTTNVVVLDPPPGSSGDFRIDFVFLEVWKVRVQPNPSTTNKPSASAIYKFGNVEGGFSYLADDLIDPALGFETNQRVQLQYRIRVVKGLVGLTTNPDGFDPVVVKAQGAAAAPTSYTFSNMRQVLGDPGLWRAGDGTENALGTVDGYVYAIPIASVFRRNGVAWNGQPSQNLNGAFNRNPTATDRSGILGQPTLKIFSTVPTLAADLSAAATTATLVSASNIAIPAASTTYIQIGDEIMTCASITGNTLNGLSRGIGVGGTIAEVHKAGTTIKVLSGRPDGLFSDQIAATDILDLRHVVSPSGMDYDALLKTSLDKLLRGQLRANWKRSGAGPQGPFVHYQDAIQQGGVSLGVTQLDSPDNIRLAFSDAAVVQPIEFVALPSTSAVAPGPGLDIDVSWSLNLDAKTIGRSSTYSSSNIDLSTVANHFSPGDVITLPVNQLKGGLQAGSTDQVRWLNDSGVVGSPPAVRLRFEGETGDLPATMYTVTPAVPGPSDDLVITLSSTFPDQTTSTATPKLLHITAHAVYGAGRGLSRRPDSLHSVAYLNQSAELLTQTAGVPTNNQTSRIGWAPLWSKYRGTTFNSAVPVTAEVYADLGSKTVVVQPFRRVNFPNLITVDGDGANPTTGTPKRSFSTGAIPSLNSTTFTDTTNGVGLSAAGDALVIPSGPGAGRYTLLNAVGTTYTVDRPILAQATGSVTYTVHAAQGVMPLMKKDGVTAKWTTTDPLELFCNTLVSGSNPTATKNIYTTLPRHLVPGWGELHVPILPVATSIFAPGVNFLINAFTGASPFGDAAKNYVNYNANSSITYAGFSTLNLQTALPATYNAAFNYAGNDFAGIRFFTDTRGLGRKGLELPPFYGVARLFAVYEAQDYLDNGSSVDPATRVATGSGATNLLRQGMPQSQGPSMWVEIDDDGDSTFILNANALDLSKSPNVIADFEDGDYVIESSIFGFDRGSFDLTKEFRLVMTRNGTDSWSNVGTGPVSLVTRSANINKVVAGPSAVVPGPATNTDQILVNYSRTVYQGDAWGSQTSTMDIGYQFGPLTSGSAFQVDSTDLDPDTLTRPNQKVLEVLASISFTTTLGTGRISGEASTSPLSVFDVGYEDPTVYPPTSGAAARPNLLPGTFAATDVTNIGTEYAGCTERLPLGALFRDKDFRGQAFGTFPAPLIFSDSVGNGLATGLATTSGLEQEEAMVSSTSSGVGAAGDVLVHVDGEQSSSNYSLLTNFRVNRGGSVFTASGSHPGGTVSLQNESTLTATSHVNVLQGRAMLVRNAVTNVGASEVSAGDELMMLILTTVQRPVPSVPGAGIITIGTNGSGEGYSAADLYRIDGHPLVRNHTRPVIDPSTIVLTRRG